MTDVMNENVIEFLRDSKTATVTFCQGRYINKIKKLAEKYPDECQVIAENADGSIVAHIPTKWIKITPTRVVTEEQREKFRELNRIYGFKPQSISGESDLNDDFEG